MPELLTGAGSSPKSDARAISIRFSTLLWLAVIPVTALLGTLTYRALAQRGWLAQTAAVLAIAFLAVAAWVLSLRLREREDEQGGEQRQPTRARFERFGMLAKLHIALGLGLLFIVFFAASSGRAAFLTILSVAALGAGAALLCGFLLGFVFGIPRSRTGPRPAAQQPLPGPPPAPSPGPSPAAPPTPAAAPPAAAAGGNAPLPASTGAAAPARAASYGANTNLEEISDWLTKILVGVSLTQLAPILNKLKGASYVLASGMAVAPVAPPTTFAMMILVYFSACGFLIGYLWTRLYLPGALQRADRDAIEAVFQEVRQARAQVKEAAEQIDELKRQSEIDARTLNLVGRQLNPPAGAAETPLSPHDLKELTEAILAASPTVKIQIFYQAAEVRSRTWRELKDKPRMERTIPIFRALIACDTKREFHKNYGQLGFALKDKLPPDWPEAEAALNEAIRIRGPWKVYGWVIYEFNRAICWINLDPETTNKQHSKPEVRERILNDLRAAFQSDLRDTIRRNEYIKNWMVLNNVKEGDLA